MDNANLEYEISVIDETGHIIAERTYRINDLTENRLILEFDTVTPKKLSTYYLVCNGVNADNSNYISFPYFSEEIFDLYPRGSLFIDGENATGDAVFCVKNVTNGPYVSKTRYWGCVLILIALQILIYYKLRRKRSLKR